MRCVMRWTPNSLESNKWNPLPPCYRFPASRRIFHTEEGIARAVDGVSFSLFGRQTLAIVGESGCGKKRHEYVHHAALADSAGQVRGRVHCLQGAGPAYTAGETDAEDQGRRDRDDFSGAHDEPQPPCFSIGDQIIEAILLHQEVNYAQATVVAEQALRRVGISEPRRRLAEYPHQMSGGMKQRVMIAMALACEPSVLIADEPTTALDVTIQAQILELMRDIQSSTGMGILLITHDLGVVAENADVVAVMYAGKIVEYASVFEVFANPLHPYTKGLLACVPKLGGTAGGYSREVVHDTGDGAQCDAVSEGGADLRRGVRSARGEIRKLEEESPPGVAGR